MKFLHVADIHLGYQQYKSDQRYEDFSASFNWLVRYAIEKEVDALIISGDLFHKRIVDPFVLYRVIKKFQHVKFPVIIIEGNHEKSYFVDKDSWINFIGMMGAAILLDTGYYDVGNVRFYGMKYAGAKTDEYVLRLAKAGIGSEKFTVLMLHAGVIGQHSHAGKLSETTIEVLKEKVDYVALGHIHKPYVIDDFVFNPGSPENVAADEALYPYRGAIMVDVNDNGEFEYEFVVPPRRPLHRINIDIDGFTSPEIVYEAVGQACEEIDDKDAIMDIMLSGEITFSRSDINTKVIQSMIDALIVHVRNEAAPIGFGVAINEEQEKDIENTVMLQVIKRDSRYRERARFWTNTALTIKDLAIDGENEDIITYLGGVL